MLGLVGPYLWLQSRSDLPSRQLIGGVSLPAAAGLDVEVEGAALLGRGDDAGAARLWFDLGPGEGAVLRVLDGRDPVALLPFR